MMPAVASGVASLVDYGQGAVVSRTLAKGPAGNLTVFAFDRGEGLAEHSAPFDAWALVVEGQVQLTIGGNPVAAGTGQLVLMPAHVPHAVRALERCKLLLVMFKHAG
jgi:quercetin dioxygenase-like cupin family protein